MPPSLFASRRPVPGLAAAGAAACGRASPVASQAGDVVFSRPIDEPDALHGAFGPLRSQRGRDCEPSEPQLPPPDAAVVAVVITFVALAAGLMGLGLGYLAAVLV